MNRWTPTMVGMSMEQTSAHASLPPRPSPRMLEERDQSNLPAIVLDIHARLCAAYGCPVAYFGNRDPLSQLVSSLLSQRTNNKAKSIAFKSLKDAFPTWEAVREAPVEAVQDAIKAATWPEQKAPRIKALLNDILEKTGALTLDFLQEMSVADARVWLETLNGVGPKTSAAVLSFSNLRSKALPVDAHHHRVAARLALIPDGMGPGKAHAVLESLLPENWTPQDYYDHHEVMMFHGQRCCYFKTPQCDRCPLLDLCPTGRAHLQQ